MLVHKTFCLTGPIRPYISCVPHSRWISSLIQRGRGTVCRQSKACSAFPVSEVFVIPVPLFFPGPRERRPVQQQCRAASPPSRLCVDPFVLRRSPAYPPRIRPLFPH